MHILLAAPEALVLAEAEPDAIKCAWLLPEQAAKVYAVGVPFVTVLGSVQLNIPPVNESSAAPQAALAAEVVVLQESEDVLFIYLYYAHFNCTKVHRTEGEYEGLLVRQNVTTKWNLHGGLLLTLAECAAVCFAQGVSCGILEALVYCEL